ncbi:MAG: hypothetical protein R3F56_16570 [Planctomycetota bacterium]
MMKSLLLPFVLIAARVPAQQATTATYGFGCGPEHAPLAATLSYVGLPRLGSTVNVHFQSPTWSAGLVSTIGYLYSGFSWLNWAGRPLPIWAVSFGFNSPVTCMIWTPLEFPTGVAAAVTNGQIRLNIPTNSSLVGLQIYQQWRLEQNVSIGGVTFGTTYWTNGGILTIGT